MKFKVLSFYYFVNFEKETLSDLRVFFFDILSALNMQGTVLLAEEGINAFVAGCESSMNDFIEKMNYKFDFFHKVDLKFSYADQSPFKKLIVKVKSEILTFDFKLDSFSNVGEHVDVDNWNKLITDPEVIVLDVRNDYEVERGSFINAVNPKTKNFKDFKDFVYEKLSEKKNAPIAMFCTGGIRCEKASAFMIKEGFREIYQLNGGILRYLEDVNKGSSTWQGECFVFDDRFAVDSNLNPTDSK